MIVAISAHRFICIVHGPSILKKKSWIFILPVLIFSILLNIPTFLNYELKYEENISTGETIIGFKPTELRNDKDFKYYYIFLTRNIVTVFIPTILLLFFNGIVIWKLFQNHKEFKM